jgi:hypothetical protein
MDIWAHKLKKAFSVTVTKPAATKMADSLYYLSPNFDPAGLTVSELASILAANDVLVPQVKARKSVYVELFQKNIASKRTELLKRYTTSVKPKTKGVVEVGMDGQERELGGSDLEDERYSKGKSNKKVGFSLRCLATCFLWKLTSLSCSAEAARFRVRRIRLRPATFAVGTSALPNVRSGVPRKHLPAVLVAAAANRSKAALIPPTTSKAKEKTPRRARPTFEAIKRKQLQAMIRQAPRHRAAGFSFGSP